MLILVCLQQTLGESPEVYFVEPEARRITEVFQRELQRLTREIKIRNRVTSIAYENLVPSWIPNSKTRPRKTSTIIRL